MSGRYGPYVKWNKTNATLPNETAPEDITLERALELISARAAKGKPKRAPAKRKAKAKQPAAEDA
jgi:DNA topoisomerase I